MLSTTVRCDLSKYLGNNCAMLHHSFLLRKQGALVSDVAGEGEFHVNRVCYTGRRLKNGYIRERTVLTLLVEMCDPSAGGFSFSGYQGLRAHSRLTEMNHVWFL